MNYLTVLEYRRSPTAVDTTNLVAAGNQAAQDAELYRKIARASAWADSFCDQPLGAAVRTASQTVTFGRGGTLVLRPGPWPLLALTALSTGPQANQLSAMAAGDLAAVWVNDNTFVVPAWSGASALGSIQLGTPRPGGRALAVYSYVSGYPSTYLTADCAAGNATVLTVASSAGMTVGSVVTIEDGASAEDCTVTAVLGPTSVTVATTLFAHTAGSGRAAQVAVHAMPADLREAITLVTTALIRARGNDALVMANTLSPGPSPGPSPTTSADLRMAREILGNYRRVY